MEKISLYDLLTLLLPGALLTFFIELIASNYNFNLDELGLNQYFNLAFFLSSSIFLGSLINVLTNKWLKYYRKIGLYTDIGIIYKNNKNLKRIKPFFQEKLKTIIGIEEFKKNSRSENFDIIWDEIYYELEAKDQINSPKTFQSFYFFFRNFFTLGIILFLPTLILCIYTKFQSLYVLLFLINLSAILISWKAGDWNRRKMVDRMFWTYYSIYKTK